MSYENVDVSSLKSSLNNCLNKLNNCNLSGTISDLNNNDIWQAKAKNNLKNAVNKLSSERYSDLTTLLRRYLQIADLINQYKGFESDAKSITSVRNRTQTRLNIERSKPKPNRTTIKNLQSDITTYNTQISNLTGSMSTVEKQINGLI